MIKKELKKTRKLKIKEFRLKREEKFQKELEINGESSTTPRLRIRVPSARMETPRLRGSASTSTWNRVIPSRYNITTS